MKRKGKERKQKRMNFSSRFQCETGPGKTKKSRFSVLLLLLLLLLLQRLLLLLLLPPISE